jgi:EAL domain-containing protein (putative c-di-GMP-specific phosphodiesterase class I)
MGLPKGSIIQISGIPNRLMSKRKTISVDFMQSKRSDIISSLKIGIRKAFLNPITYIGAIVVGTFSFLSRDNSWGFAVPFMVPMFIQAFTRFLAEYENNNNNDQSEYRGSHENTQKIISVISDDALLNVFNKSLATNTPKLLMQIRINSATEVVRLTHEKHLKAEETLIYLTYKEILTEFSDGEIYRLAKDTFLCIVNGTYEQVQKRIETFVKSHAPFRIKIEGHLYYPCLLTGITPLNTSVASTLSILEYACQKAFLSAKVSHYFLSGDESEIKNHIEMRKGLRHVRRALDAHELGLFAQPIVPIDGIDCKPKYELLLRHYFNGEINSPLHVLSRAKFNGVIQDVDTYVIELLASNFHQLFGLRGENIDSVSINISGSSYTSPHFNQALVSIFKLYDIPAHKIVLEVTEDIITINADDAITNMHYLKDHGFKLALDDIGIGSSNFSNLGRFPVDYYKIDRAYCERMTTDVGISRFVELIISEAHRRDKKVIAEGVPNQETLSYLKSLGVHFSQSFITGMPVEMIPAPKFLINQ